MYISLCKPVLASPSSPSAEQEVAVLGNGAGSSLLGKLSTSDGRVYEIHQWPVVNLGPFEGETAFPLRLEIGGVEIVTISHKCVNQGRPGRYLLPLPSAGLHSKICVVVT